MSNALLLEKIETLIANPAAVTQEFIESLIKDTVSFCNSLRTKLESGDEKEREEAMKLAADLRTKLESQAMKLGTSMGLNPMTIESMFHSPTFNAEATQMLDKTTAMLNKYNDELTQPEKNKTKTKKMKKYELTV
jgi:hypothetical protein